MSAGDSSPGIEADEAHRVARWAGRAKVTVLHYDHHDAGIERL